MLISSGRTCTPTSEISPPFGHVRTSHLQCPEVSTLLPHFLPSPPLPLKKCNWSLWENKGENSHVLTLHTKRLTLRQFPVLTKWSWFKFTCQGWGVGENLFKKKNHRSLSLDQELGGGCWLVHFYHSLQAIWTPLSLGEIHCLKLPSVIGHK